MTDRDTMSEQVGGDVVKREAAALERVDTDRIPLLDEHAIERAERMVDNLVKIKRLALKATTRRDWVDFQGAPYLTANGVDAIALLFGINLEGLRVVEQRVQQGDAQIIRFVAHITARYGKITREAEGVVSTRNKFFGRVGGEQKRVEDIDTDSLRAMAGTRAASNAVKKLLGLGGLTWEDIEAAV